MSTDEHKQRRAKAAARKRTQALMDQNNGEAIEAASGATSHELYQALGKILAIQEKAPDDETRGRLRCVQAGLMVGLARVYLEESVLSPAPPEARAVLRDIVGKIADKAEDGFRAALLDACDKVLENRFGLVDYMGEPLLPS